MRKIVFLVEEASMEEMLRAFLPTLFPEWLEGQHWQCVPHDGKSDLEASIPRKLRAWREPGVRFVVLRDQDAAACEKVKAKLVKMCAAAGRPDTLIRIACRELESWYLGDLHAVESGLRVRGLASQQDKRRYRSPDRLVKPSHELTRLAPTCQKRAGSRAIGRHLAVERNRSHSFRMFVSGLKGIVEP